MRSLFLKVFLWFFLATTLSGLAHFVIGYATHSGPAAEMQRRHEEEWRRQAGQTLARYAESAAAALSGDGRVPLEAQTALLEQASRIRVLLLLRGREAVSDRGASETARRLAARAAGGDSPVFETDGGRSLLAVRVAGPGGISCVAVGEALEPPARPEPGGPPPPLPPPPPRGGFLVELAHYTRFLGLQSLVTFIVGGLFCLGLAWHLTAPLRRLRTATQRLRAGDLTARVGAAAIRGRDEIAALGRDFDLMAERIEGLMTAERQLLRDISHELRSPLARLNVALELARQRAGREAEGALERIERESERLNQLIGQLLTLTQLESGAERIERSPVPLGPLVRAIAADAQFEAQRHGRAVELSVADEVVISGSEEMLRRGIENVVRNALRYTPQETRVEVWLGRRREAAGERAVIRVRDHGPGVPSAALSKLFLPFYRVADARDRQTGGTGIGLAITERAVRLHGGSVSAGNAPDGGLVVEILLPAAPAPPDAPAGG